MTWSRSALYLPAPASQHPCRRASGCSVLSHRRSAGTLSSSCPVLVMASHLLPPLAAAPFPLTPAVLSTQLSSLPPRMSCPLHSCPCLCVLMTVAVVSVGSGGGRGESVCAVSAGSPATGVSPLPSESAPEAGTLQMRPQLADLHVHPRQQEGDTVARPLARTLPHSDFAAASHLEQETALGPMQLCVSRLPACALCNTASPQARLRRTSLLSQQHCD